MISVISILYLFAIHVLQKIQRAKNKSVGAVKSARQDKANSSLIWCGFAEGDARECSSCARRVKLSAGGPRKKSQKQKVTKILAVDKSCTAENEDVHLDEPLSPCRPVITSDDDSFTPALSALLQTDEVNAHDDSTAIKDDHLHRLRKLKIPLQR